MPVVTHDPVTKLWHVPLTYDMTRTQVNSPPNHQSNQSHQTNTQDYLIQHLHQCCFSPKKTTCIKAMKNNQFTTYPRLKLNAIIKHVTPSMVTAKGQLDQTQNKKIITKQKTTFKIYEYDIFPLQ